MKMENVLRAERDGTVAQIARQTGRQPRGRPGHPRIRVSARRGKRSVRLRITGRVQGVGYRAWAMRPRRALGLRGWVRNRADGSVEALVIGDEAAVARMVEACREGPARRPGRRCRSQRCRGRRQRRLHAEADAVTNLVLVLRCPTPSHKEPLMPDDQPDDEPYLAPRAERHHRGV